MVTGMYKNGNRNKNIINNLVGGMGSVGNVHKTIIPL